MPDKPRRGTIAPIIANPDGSWEWAAPQILLDAWDAVNLPGDVYAGQIDPMSEEGMRRAINLASVLGPSTFAGSARKLFGNEGANALLAKAPLEYDPPKYPQRAFRDDYPNGATTDAAGKLQFDIEGRPLTARYVAGRAQALRPDTPIRRPDDLAGVAEGATGRAPATVPRSDIGGALGGTYLDKSGRPISIAVADDLHPDDVPRVLAHELGHVIDLKAGPIPTDGLERELGFIYHTQATGDRWTANPVTPQSIGYPDAEAPYEYIAEAIRNYLLDPNSIKSVAPETAARIRAYVNDHPELRDTIQFNVGGAPVLTAPSDNPMPSNYGGLGGLGGMQARRAY